MAEETKLSAKLEKLVSEIEALSVLELSELVEALQVRLGVSAAAPVPPTGGDAPAGDAATGEGASAPSTQTVVLTAPGANKIAVIFVPEDPLKSEIKLT